jgi:hypothetical protein
VAATSRQEISYLDTLAAAYAEAGQYAKAVSALEDAIALEYDDTRKKDYASKLRLYQSGSPYRESP